MVVCKHKSKYRTPKKGTITRSIVLLLLKPCGVSSRDIEELGINPKFFSRLVSETLRDECGFDTQWISKSLPRGTSGTGARLKTYRIIGRNRWNGSYRSFL